MAADDISVNPLSLSDIDAGRTGGPAVRWPSDPVPVRPTAPPVGPAPPARTPVVYPPVHAAPVNPISAAAISAAPVTPAIVTAAPVTAVLASITPTSPDYLDHSSYPGRPTYPYPDEPGPPMDPTPPVRRPAVPVWHQPVWRPPASRPPASRPPASRPPVWPAQPPTTAPYRPTTQPAREESPRSRPPVGALVLGLLLGLILFGSTGYVVGARAADSTVDTAPAAVGGAGDPSASGSPAPAPSATEDARTATNRRVVGPALASLTESWLPALADCISSSEAGGPVRQQGEQYRVLCAVNTIGVYFVQYGSAADLSKVRTTRQKQNADAARIAPGAARIAAERSGASGRTTGRYIEFAYRVGGRTMNGIWWDDTASATAAYVETQWTDGADGWRPLRDIWERYS
jgi:hypothetical protein